MTQEEILKIKLDVYSRTDAERTKEIEKEIKELNMKWLEEDKEANKE